MQAAKFLHMLHIYRIFDLPYQSQIVPLAAILADIGDAWEHEANRAKLVRWYWNGVFGELYGSAVETRIARDFMEVPAWLKGGPEPSTVSETTVPRRPAEDHADASVRRLQGRQRAPDEGRRTGFPFGPEIRPHGLLRRERRHPSHLPAGLVQETEASSRTSSTPSSTRRRFPIARTGSSAALRHPSTWPSWRRERDNTTDRS